ncbi:hypothetical protein D918_07784 [Trichuris suis]|nr:hypothetical protein D918_07784 [Trichuris suis]
MSQHERHCYVVQGRYVHFGTECQPHVKSKNIAIYGEVVLFTFNSCQKAECFQFLWFAYLCYPKENIVPLCKR